MTTPNVGRGNRASGFGLVELMVALAIGLFLIAGAVTIFAKTRDLYRANETAARLQETARLAMSTIEVDLRMANYWGLNNRPDLIDGGLRQNDASSLNAELSANPGQIEACGNNWAIDVETYIDGSNNEYDLSCLAAVGANSRSDVLVVRRASVTPIPDANLGASVGQLKVRTGRVQSALFTDDSPPSSGVETRAVLVNGYYVAADPSADPYAGAPALRRKQLGFTAAGPSIEDVEVVQGVEDLQFQVGIDTDDDQSANYYVDIDDVLLTDVPVAVRVWLLIRTDRPEVGFTDDRSYEYGDRVNANAYQPNDGFRRLLVSRTIQLRNTRR